MMEYQLVRSKRKSIAISFDQACDLVVKAPLWVPKGRIDAFVKEKEEWIKATKVRLERAKEEADQSRLRLENGDELYFLGEKRILNVIREDRKRSKVVCAMDRLLMYVPYDADYEYKREQLEKWYRKEAAEILTQKAEEFAKRLGVSFTDIRIKDQKSRWGSCSSKGNLNFNWRIIMAPEPVCDYVVIHELIWYIWIIQKSFGSLLRAFAPIMSSIKNG
jgi:predicted metal-dependent hydrolase